MAIGDEDHGRIAMAVAAMLTGAVHQPFDLALGEVAPLDCQVYDAWGAFLGCRFHRTKAPLLAAEWRAYTHLLHSQIETGCSSWSAARPTARRGLTLPWRDG